MLSKYIPGWEKIINFTINIVSNVMGENLGKFPDEDMFPSEDYDDNYKYVKLKNGI